MARSMMDVRQTFDRLSLGNQEPASGNLSIQTPEKNVTLVLNFGHGYNSESSAGVNNNNNTELRTGLVGKKARFNSQISNDSNSVDDSSSQSAGSRSPSDSPSSSTPSTPELNRGYPTKLKSAMKAGTQSVKPKAIKSEKKPESVERKKRPPPSRGSLEKFMNSQGSQLNQTVALSEYYRSDAYPENWVKKKHYLSFTKHHRIRDVKFDGDCNVILTSRHSVQLYDGNGHFMERLYNEKIQEPWGLHLHDNGNVFVSDHKNDCVKEFTHIGIQIQKYGPVPSPCGVAVSSSGFVFVCSKDDGCVYVFDKNNKLVKKIGEGTLTAPAHIVLHDKLVLVSDEARIIGFTTENSIAFVYGHSESSNHPACLTVDRKTGFVLATSYYRSSIIAVKRDMDRAILVKETVRPNLCALSPYGHLLVGERLSKGVNFKMFRAGKDS